LTDLTHEIDVTVEETDFDSTPVVITHHRDTIYIDGKIEQDYRFLNYTFECATGTQSARVYFDDPWEVSILEPILQDGMSALDPEFVRYLKRRFNIIKQLGGPEGYTVLWQAKSGQ
jgi:hypothetical protein